MAFVGLDVRLAGPQRGPVEEGMICKRCTHFSSRARLHCKTVTLSASGRDATSALDPSLSEVRLWLPHERYAETLGAFLALDAQVNLPARMAGVETLYRWHLLTVGDINTSSTIGG